MQHSARRNGSLGAVGLVGRIDRMRSFDLHSHSTSSDGLLSPAALVARAIERRVDVLALTDHDETGGIEEARDAARGSALTLIAAAELSTSWQSHTIHVVGLNLD